MFLAQQRSKSSKSSAQQILRRQNKYMLYLTYQHPLYLGRLQRQVQGPTYVEVFPQHLLHHQGELTLPEHSPTTSEATGENKNTSVVFTLLQGM